MEILQDFASQVLARAVSMGREGSDNRITARNPERSPSGWTYSPSFDDPPDERRARTVREADSSLGAIVWWDAAEQESSDLELVCESYDLTQKAALELRQPMHRTKPSTFPALMTPRGSVTASAIGYPDTSRAEFADWGLDGFASSVGHHIQRVAVLASKNEVGRIAGYAYLSEDRTRRVQRGLTRFGEMTLIRSRDAHAPDRKGTLDALDEAIENDPAAGLPQLRAIWWSQPRGAIEAEFRRYQHAGGSACHVVGSKERPLLRADRR